MKTEKNLKLSFNLFRFFGWLTVVMFIFTVILSFTEYTLTDKVAFDICLNPVLAYAMYQVYINNQKRIDPNYKVNMLNHYKSAFYTVIVTFAFSLVLIAIGRHLDVVILILGIATYFASYLTLIAKSKNNQI